MTLIMIRNGQRTDLSDILRVKEFLVQPLEILYDEYNVDQGEPVSVPRGYGARRINATFRFSGITMTTYALKLAEFRALFTHRDPFYLIDSYDVNKVWYVRNEGNFSVNRSSKHADINVSFLCINKYAQTINSVNGREKNWSSGTLFWSDNISWSEELVTGFSDTMSVDYKYYGTADLDPRENPLVINIRGSFPGGLKLNNETTGESFELNKNIPTNSIVVLNGTNVLLNGEDVRNESNYGIISLKPGINRISFNSVVDSIVFEHHNYYL